MQQRPSCSKKSLAITEALLTFIWGFHLLFAITVVVWLQVGDFLYEDIRETWEAIPGPRGLAGDAGHPDAEHDPSCAVATPLAGIWRIPWRPPVLLMILVIVYGGVYICIGVYRNFYMYVCMYIYIPPFTSRLGP